MSDFWLVQYGAIRHKELMQEAERNRQIYQAKHYKALISQHKAPISALFYRAGQIIEATGQYLQKRFAPPLAKECTGCVKPLAR